MYIKCEAMANWPLILFKPKQAMLDSHNSLSEMRKCQGGCPSPPPHVGATHLGSLLCGRRRRGHGLGEGRQQQPRAVAVQRQAQEQALRLCTRHAAPAPVQGFAAAHLQGFACSARHSRQIMDGASRNLPGIT